MDKLAVVATEILGYCQLAQRISISRTKAHELLRAKGYRIAPSAFNQLWETAKATEQVWPTQGIVP
jgi:hypothetical protein